MIPRAALEIPVDIESLDFFNDPTNRLAILKREGFQCFYCLKKIDSGNSSIDHVDASPEGNNSYRNLVAACLNCNSRKGRSSAEDFIRALFRSGFLSESEFSERSEALGRLRRGELRPEI
jgi:hypothetical protein